MIMSKKIILGFVILIGVTACVKQQQNIPLFDTVTVVDQLVINDKSVPIFPKSPVKIRS